MWTYVQLTGAFLSPSGLLIAYGYAGAGIGRNNPRMQTVKNVGPLPCGFYTMNPPVDTKDHGPYVIWLTPDDSNLMFNRGDFGIHGDSIPHPGSASEGCIIQPRFARERAWESNDHRLQVITGFDNNAEQVQDAAMGEN
jgi:hypothetical protein